jgi:phosphomannomutase
MVAAYNRTLGQLLDSMMDQVGYLYYTREDLHLEMDKKDRLMNTLLHHTPDVLEDMVIVSSNCLDGCKLYLQEGWVMFRPSGTEPIVRIYVEVNHPDLLKDVMRKAVHYAENQ